MAEKAAAPKETEQADSPHIANLKFREKALSDKLARIKAMSDEEFGSDKGHNRQESIRRTESGLAEIQRELKKAAK